MERHLRVVCMTKREDHHSASGGYDALGRYLGADLIPQRALGSVAGRALNGAWRLGVRRRLDHYDYQLGARLAEEAAFWTALRRRADVVHALYGESQLDALLGRAGLLPATLVATFHMPTETLRRIFARMPEAALRRLDGVLTVGSAEVPALSEWLGAERVAFVPHGIDTGAFAPAPFVRGPVARFLFVGWHMRDFAVAHAVADRCAQAGLAAEFHAVLKEDKYAFFTACPNVRFHTGVGEAELVALYRGADALFLPLLDATANNAVLEALACGTPVITSDVGSIRDYVDEGCGWLLPPGDADAAFACVAAIVADPGPAAARRAAARAKAEEFAWLRVAGQTRAAYARFAAAAAARRGRAAKRAA